MKILILINKASLYFLQGGGGGVRTRVLLTRSRLKNVTPRILLGLYYIIGTRHHSILVFGYIILICHSSIRHYKIKSR